MKKAKLSLTSHELYVCVLALNDLAESSHQERRIMEDPGERHDLEEQESDATELAEKLDAIRLKLTPGAE